MIFAEEGDTVEAQNVFFCNLNLVQYNNSVNYITHLTHNL